MVAWLPLTTDDLQDHPSSMLRMRVRSVLTSGGVECILGVLLFLVAINGWFSGTRHGTWNPWWDAVTLALLFAMTRWPRAGLAAMMAAACAGVDARGKAHA